MTFDIDNQKVQIESSMRSMKERDAMLKEMGAVYYVEHDHPENTNLYAQSKRYKTLKGALKYAYRNGFRWAALISVVDGVETFECHLY